MEQPILDESLYDGFDTVPDLAAKKLDRSALPSRVSCVIEILGGLLLGMGGLGSFLMALSRLAEREFWPALLTLGVLVCGIGLIVGGASWNGANGLGQRFVADRTPEALHKWLDQYSRAWKTWNTYFLIGFGLFGLGLIAMIWSSRGYFF